MQVTVAANRSATAATNATTATTSSNNSQQRISFNMNMLSARRDSSCDDFTATSFLDRLVYAIPTGSASSINIYTWLEPQEFERLSHPEGESILSAWLHCLEIDCGFSSEPSVEAVL